MGAKADQDLWGQVMAAELRHGEHAPEFITQKAQALRRAGEYCEAEFWTQVAECLRDLHAIKFAGAGKVLGNIGERQASQIANYRSSPAPRTMGGPSPNSNS